MISRNAIVALVLFASLSSRADAQGSFKHWETPHVHPLELSADGAMLLAVSTPDNRLELFDVSGRMPVGLGAIPVGLAPVSVRLRTPTEAWVVNQVSDSVSIVDLSAGNVVLTLTTEDEPTDVVFAGSPERAFVTCSQVNRVLVFDPMDLSQAPIAVDIDAEDPRGMAVSPDGSEVYVAILESGNGSTILGGGNVGLGFPPNVVNDVAGPYGGVNPPPNDGASFVPPINGANPAAPAVGLIVKKDAVGFWMDDNGGDWTALVSGANAAASGRPIGWDLPDHDIAIIDAATLSVSYANQLMNIGMAISVNPSSGDVALVGTDATNEIRFEPNLTGTFVRVNLALVDPSAMGGPSTIDIVDLNPHLDYLTGTVVQGLRDLSIGDPRGIVWNGAGTRAYVTGMGSNNVIILDPAGARTGSSPTIEVGEGPTGIVFDVARDRLYVLNKFEASISTISTITETELGKVPFFDPSPDAIKVGRKHLYDTHKNSGLGQIACASCHVDARMDRLAWDLGNPAGAMKGMNQNCPDGGCQAWHPMKGPMTTQSLQDIIGREPLHWRGDKDGIEEFNGAFTGLQGDDTMLTSQEMQEFEDFLATVAYPPNPFRNFDNSLPDNLPLDGHFTTGRFAAAGQPLPNGDATRGLDLYRPPNGLDGGVACATCHTMPTGMGTDNMLVGVSFVPIPPGPNGERHHALVSVDGSTNVTMKVPQLRNQYEKTGFNVTQASNRSGFGFLHDGSVDSIEQFISEPVFSVANDQEVADLVAFMLAFSGSDLPQGSGLLEPPGSPGLDTHAAVGVQTTLVDLGSAPAQQISLLTDMIALAETQAVGLVVKGVQGGLQRGYAYQGSGSFQSDRAAESLTSAQLQGAAAAGSELTWTIVPHGSQTRIGIDRDEDGIFDRDELDAATVHVQSISFLSLGGVGIPALGLFGFVRITDATGAPVQGAGVAVTWSDAFVGSAHRRTNRHGLAAFRAPYVGSFAGCWTLEVTNVTGAGLTYDAGANVETSDSFGASCP